MRILFIGDVVGKSGRQAVRTHLPECIAKLKVDLCVVNGENGADQGFGITAAIYEELLASGADAVTLGNHSWNRSAMAPDLVLRADSSSWPAVPAPSEAAPSRSEVRS